MKDYKQLQDALFCEWRNSPLHKGVEPFNADGIVNYEKWCNQDLKILFIFKEAYHKIDVLTSDGIYDLAADLSKYGPWRMWNRVSEWAHGVQHTTQDAVAPFRKLDFETSNGVINSIAVVNVKKSGGKAQSKDEDLTEYVSQDKEYLKRQIHLIEPDIIICGNTFSYVNEILGNQIDKKAAYCENWFYKIDNYLILDYFHPANQFPALLNYYGICCIYQQALSR